MSFLILSHKGTTLRFVTLKEEVLDLDYVLGVDVAVLV